MLLEFLEESLSLLEKLPAVVERNPERILFIGDLHGYLDVIPYVERELEDEKMTVVFLGDYVDRGPNQIEALEKVLELFTAYPNRVIPLRGNHEDEEVNRMYDFYYVVQNKLNIPFDRINELYSRLPIAFKAPGVVALHGGLPVVTMRPAGFLERLEKSISTLEDKLREVLRNDPNDMVDDYAPSVRGKGIYEFGRKPVEEFFSHYKDVYYLIRAHQIFSNGYRRHFDGRVLTITSLPPVARIAEVYYHEGVPIVRVARPIIY